MIPKIIHYCWLSSDPYPEKIAYCLNSWHKMLPDYEIRLWDLHRFPLDKSVWVKEAYESKKYAFAADYIRAYALYHFGGIYLDSDVEVIRPYDDLLQLSYFLGFERDEEGYIEAATMATEPGNPLFKHLLDYYEGRHFNNNGKLDTTPLPVVMKGIVDSYYSIRRIEGVAEWVDADNTLSVFPSDYFSPKDENDRLHLTERTYSIHHFAGTWRPALHHRLRKMIISLCGPKGKQLASTIYSVFKK